MPRFFYSITTRFVMSSGRFLMAKFFVLHLLMQPTPVPMHTMAHANHLYTPRPTNTALVVVMAALLLPMPNMLLLCRMTASCAFSCECPDT
jgi:hypothetical protein